MALLISVIFAVYAIIKKHRKLLISAIGATVYFLLNELGFSPMLAEHSLLISILKNLAFIILALYFIALSLNDKNGR